MDEAGGSDDDPVAEKSLNGVFQASPAKHIEIFFNGCNL